MSVGTFRLDYHTAKVEWILHQFTSFLNGHTLLLAEFSQQGCIFLRLGVVLRVDECGLVDVCQAPLLCQRVNLVWIADKDQVGHIVCQHAVGCSQCALLGGFGEYDALLVAFSAFDDFLY